MNERWVPAFEYEGLYEVSNLGRVRRLGGTPKCLKTRLVQLVPLKERGGYMAVSLWKNGRGLMRRLSRLVYQSFHGRLAPKLEIHHIDEDRTNDDLGNLKALTKTEHVAVTTHPRGEDQRSAIFTEDQVREIIRKYRRGVRGLGYRSIATSMGVRAEYIRDIIKGKTWMHVAAGLVRAEAA